MRADQVWGERKISYNGAVKSHGSKAAGKRSPSQAAKAAPPPLFTLTREPVSPVRLYYSIPSPAFVGTRLRALQCMREVPEEACWHWMFHGEAAGVSLGAGYNDVPVERRPLILSWMRFPRPGVMTLEMLSSMRAVAAARFFGPVLGPKVVALRVRVLNRFCLPSDGQGEALVRLLDRDVTVVDSRFSEHRDREWAKGARTAEDLERAAAADLQRRIEEGDDVPLVEDAPLAPEEETTDYQHLSTLLGLRSARASEHWHGNTHITLLHIIQRSVEEFVAKERG